MQLQVVPWTASYTTVHMLAICFRPLGQGLLDLWPEVAKWSVWSKIVRSSEIAQSLIHDLKPISGGVFEGRTLPDPAPETGHFRPRPQVIGVLTANPKKITSDNFTEGQLGGGYVYFWRHFLWHQ